MSNPSALIIGASRGIGLELVRQYQQAGYAVTATARSESALAALRELGATAISLDVAQSASASGLGRATNGSRFDVAVYNAGVSGPRDSGPTPPSTDDFDAVMHTNVLGAMWLLPQMAEVLAPAGATLPRLAVVSSRMGSISERSGPNMWLYRASKAAVNSVLKDMSLSLQGRAICVALHPGWVRTDMGGAGADLSVQQSAGDIQRLLAGLKPADHGGFFNHDGQRISW